MNIQDLKKRRQIDEWLGGDHVLLHVNSGEESVRLPTNLLNNPLLTLKISRLFNGKLELQEEGVLVYLKFSGEYFECFLPWNSIWAVTSEDGERKVWDQSLPKELAVATSSAKEGTSNHESVGHVEKNKGFLKRIK